MDNDFVVPGNVANDIASGMTGGRVELPFPVAYLWWNSGQADRSQEGSGVRYFGGWAADAQDVEAAGLTLPEFAREFWTAKDGGSYEVYTRRSVAVAPIAKRFRFFEGRGHLHILSLLASLQNKSYLPWGPVVLSAKGYAAMSLESALNTWAKDTAKERREFANNLPAHFFYAPLGTFGRERQQAMAGKKGQQSPYTPVQVWLPENITVETLRKWFVGTETSNLMATLKAEATPWLEAWKQREQAAAVPENGDDIYEGGYDDEQFLTM